MDELYLDIIQPDQIKSVKAEEIDAVIAQIIKESKENHEVMQELALECSASLSSAKSRSQAMGSRGVFKRIWDGITGNSARMRNAIVRDNIAAQYAMQQTITGVLKECTQNRALLMLVKGKLENEIIRLDTEIMHGDEQINRIRVALAGFYQNYMSQSKEIEKELKRQQSHLYKRCEKCGELIDLEQLICTECGTLQEFKLEGMSENMKEKLSNLSEIMQQNIKNFGSDKAWGEMAKLYEAKVNKVGIISDLDKLLENKQGFHNDIQNLISKCQNSEFQIAVVGVLKAGKSMLMNALIGMDLASVGLNSKTAALTKFRSSTEGHYVRVKFYSQSGWKKLKDSVTRHADDIQADEEAKKDSFLENLQKASVKKAEAQWVGHKVITEHYDDLEMFKKAIERWTAADSEEHLFAAEVEVGIDKTLFDMPKEVVFVDTPGLQDPVKYRSAITEKYIAKADAVLVAVKTQALTNEGFETITKVLDIAGNKTNKVYIVATQKDTLTNKDDYIEITNKWAEGLTEAGRYSSLRVAKNNMIATSAYMHICMKKVLRLTSEELNDPTKFSDNDYNYFSAGINKVIGGRGYMVGNLRVDEDTLNKIDTDFGVSLLKRRLECDLIEKFRELKVKDIAHDFALYKKQILKTAVDKKELARKAMDSAHSNVDKLQKDMEDVKSKQDNFKMEADAIRSLLEEVKDFTKQRFEYLVKNEG